MLQIAVSCCRIPVSAAMCATWVLASYLQSRLCTNSMLAYLHRNMGNCILQLRAMITSLPVLHACTKDVYDGSRLTGVYLAGRLYSVINNCRHILHILFPNKPFRSYVPPVLGSLLSEHLLLSSKIAPFVVENHFQQTPICSTSLSTAKGIGRRQWGVDTVGKSPSNFTAVWHFSQLMRASYLRTLSGM